MDEEIRDWDSDEKAGRSHNNISRPKALSVVGSDDDKQEPLNAQQPHNDQEADSDDQSCNNFLGYSERGGTNPKSSHHRSSQDQGSGGDRNMPNHERAHHQPRRSTQESRGHSRPHRDDRGPGQSQLMRACVMCAPSAHSSQMKITTLAIGGDILALGNNVLILMTGTIPSPGGGSHQASARTNSSSVFP